MRFSGLMVFVATTGYTMAQATCPPTITVTADTATLNGNLTSSHSRQTVYTTEYSTTVIISNGKAALQTMEKVFVLPKERMGLDSILSDAIPSCPNAVTVTITGGYTQNQTATTKGTSPVTSSSFSLQTNSSSSSAAVTLGFNSTTAWGPSSTSSTFVPALTTTTPDLNLSSVLSNSMSSSAWNFSTSSTSSILTSSAWVNITFSTTLNSTFLVSPSLATSVSNTTASHTGLDSASLSGQSLTSSVSNTTTLATGFNTTSASAPTLTSSTSDNTASATDSGITSQSSTSSGWSTSALTTSVTPGGTTSSASSTTELSNFTSTTAASSYGVALDIWSTPTPTLECSSFPCQLKMPCMSLPTPTTITFPPYTTSLCTPGCSGSVQMKSVTTITLPPLTTDSACFWPLNATDAGPVTPVHRWIDSAMTIDAPSGLSACPPVHADISVEYLCGEKHQYMCGNKQCCGKDGKCGSGQEFCYSGCQPNYGNCWKNSTSCKVPVFAKTEDTTPIPIFPIWYDDDSEIILPPISIKLNLDIKIPEFDFCDDLGCLNGCHILGCDGIDTGWFKVPFPNLGCNGAARKITCTFLKIGCCNQVHGGCTIPSCLPPGDIDVGTFGDFNLCGEDGCGPTEQDPESTPEPSSSVGSSSTSSSSSSECSSTTTVQDETVHCVSSTASNGKVASSCTSTATGAGRKGCSIQPSTFTSFTSGCVTQTTSDVITGCTYLTGSGNATRTECTTRASTFSGCDITGITTSTATTECSNSNTVTNGVVSCFGTNTTLIGATFTGPSTCTLTTTSVTSGCDLTGTTTSVITWVEPTCEHLPSEIVVEPWPDTPSTNSAAVTTAATTASPSGSASAVGAAASVLSAALSTAVGASAGSVSTEATTSTAGVQARWWMPLGF